MSEYWLLNLSARLASDSWTVRAFVDNFLNREAGLYLAQRDSFSQYRPASYIERSVNRPRTFGVELSLKF